MVDPVPTGTPITNETIINAIRSVPEYQVYAYNHLGYTPWVSYRHIDYQNKYCIVTFEYMGILDDKLSIYAAMGLVGPIPGSGCFIPAEVISLPKEITPQTHDVSIRWVEHSKRIARLKECWAVAVVKRKEVMQW